VGCRSIDCRCEGGESGGRPLVELVGEEEGVSGGGQDQLIF